MKTQTPKMRMCSIHLVRVVGGNQFIWIFVSHFIPIFSLDSNQINLRQQIKYMYISILYEYMLLSFIEEQFLIVKGLYTRFEICVCVQLIWMF